MDPKAGTGLAIRFPPDSPGGIGRISPPEQATTVREVMEMFRNQKKIGEQSIDESI